MAIQEPKLSDVEDTAEKLAEELVKTERGSYFSFDTGYSTSNSVDREFLQSLVDEKDLQTFKKQYVNG